MPITPGTRLGPYEIQSVIGVGGMGEVYKARDSRLERIVAIKVLPSHVASDPELCQRFEREARAIAARAQYAVAPDGRFLMNVAADDAVTSPITVVLNWTAGLKK